jgi:hypothetical protein
MAQPKWLKKYLTLKPEVAQIFKDLDAWLNYCRFNLIKYDPADLYRSPAYKEWQEKRRKREQRRNRDGDSRNQRYTNRPKQ